MDLPNILNNRGGPGLAMTANHHLQHYADLTARAMSDTGSERGMSPHLSDRGHYGRPTNQLQNLGMDSVPHHQQFSLASNPYPTPTGSIEGSYTHGHDDQLQTPTSDSAAQMKAFACSSCGKGFARRSDLARHERIHTGVRPHVCEHPGCGKQFIQRSALTVHTRVHTGEKPHMCEHCTKPFSDSSSLARHRRIHSGKRPYKCPYAHCQKTFTRRTTLTRHQSHHTGTVEESKAQADAVFANRPAPQRLKTEGLTYSDAGSSRSSPVSDRNLSAMHSATDLSQTQMLPRQADFSYMGGLPPHLRHDMPQSVSRSGSASPSLSGYGLASRPSFTSHPNAYNSLPPLEPPTAQNDPRTAGSQSGGSPHLSSIGWQTPPHPNVGSPMAGNGYVYPEQAYDLSASNLYYANQAHRRTQSAEPDHYDMKPRMPGNEVWAGQLS